MTAKPFLVALILGAAAALFTYRDRVANWFPKGEHLPDNLGVWQVQATTGQRLIDNAGLRLTQQPVVLDGGQCLRRFALALPLPVRCALQ